MTPSQKRRGRPSIEAGEPTESVPVRLPRSLYDAICRTAAKRDVSVSQIVREALKRPTSTTSTA